MNREVKCTIARINTQMFPHISLPEPMDRLIKHRIALINAQIDRNISLSAFIVDQYVSYNVLDVDKLKQINIEIKSLIDLLNNLYGELCQERS